ncbi:MAG: S26 family signal peptidase [Anaerolineae bacterium]
MMFFAAFIGRSMNPTLREPEIIEILPYGTRPVRVGDVVLFLPPEADQPIVHRVVHVTSAGISTLGDNNTHEDTLVLPPKSIKGQVVAAWRGQNRRKIEGGLQGKVIGLWLHLRRVLARGVFPILHPFYQSLSHWRLIAWALPAPLRPRVFVFHARGRDQFQLLLGQCIIGKYNTQRHQWQIRLPFLLFLDDRVLPWRQGQDRLDK